MKSWRTVSSRTVAENPLFRLERRRIERGPDGDGEREEREIVAIDSKDWVQIVPLLSDPDRLVPDRLIMVRQWRYATESFHLELPGGIVDDEGGDRDAAERELAEETGYRARSWERLGEMEPNPAILDNRLTVWLATDLERIPPDERPEGDEDEELEVVEVPLAEIPGLVRRGEIRHALMVSSLYLFDLRSHLDRDRS
jgi:8-oxo-dGTP pyrophosphatase MutT (NUDIX family)